MNGVQSPFSSTPATSVILTDFILNHSTQGKRIFKKQHPPFPANFTAFVAWSIYAFECNQIKIWKLQVV